jgi:hypothetical protein
MRRLAVLAAMALLTVACELTEVTIAVPQDLVVAEVVLRAGDTIQSAYLHRTLGAEGTARVFNAALAVTEQGAGSTIQFRAVDDSLCLSPAPPGPEPGIGVCYMAHGRADMVKPGTRYTMELLMPDGRRLSGSTDVPAAFRVTVPVASPCRLAPGSSIELTWIRSAGASVYIGETRLRGLVAALRRAGVEVPGEDRDVDLLALSIGSEDTTMAFPGDFGVFDRFDQELHPILVALRGGLPPGVDAEIVIAAADRNYVNWVRGGSFNPSGAVRVPSVHGDGTGVFGSLVTRRILVHTGDAGVACR